MKFLGWLAGFKFAKTEGTEGNRSHRVAARKLGAGYAAAASAAAPVWCSLCVVFVLRQIPDLNGRVSNIGATGCGAGAD